VAVKVQFDSAGVAEWHSMEQLREAQLFAGSPLAERPPANVQLRDCPAEIRPPNQEVDVVHRAYSGFAVGHADKSHALKRQRIHAGSIERIEDFHKTRLGDSVSQPCLPIDPVKAAHFHGLAIALIFQVAIDERNKAILPNVQAIEAARLGPPCSPALDSSFVRMEGRPEEKAAPF
jgi:hypothetical protein